MQLATAVCYLPKEVVRPSQNWCLQCFSVVLASHSLVLRDSGDGGVSECQNCAPRTFCSYSLNASRTDTNIMVQGYSWAVSSGARNQPNHQYIWDQHIFKIRIHAIPTSVSVRLESVFCTSNGVTSYRLLPGKFEEAFINDTP